MRYVQKISKHKQVVIQMGTTYWGRNFGLMVIKDALRKKIIWRKYVTHETGASYLEGVQWLRGQGFKIYGVVTKKLSRCLLSKISISEKTFRVYFLRLVQNRCKLLGKRS